MAQAQQELRFAEVAPDIPGNESSQTALHIHAGGIAADIHNGAEVVHGAECVDCPYDKVCPKCPALRLSGLKTGYCNPAVCELTRRLVAAGVKKLAAPEKTACQDGA